MEKKEALTEAPDSHDLKSENDPLILLKKMRDGDSSAFDKLAEKYAPLVMSVYSSFEQTLTEIGGTESADELKLDLDMALFRSANTFDLTRSNVTFGVYAKRCLKNCAISSLRKARASKSKQQRAMAKLEDKLRNERSHHTFDTYFADYDVIDRKKIIDDVSLILSSYELSVFNKYLDGKSASCIAKELSADLKSVNNAIFRSKRKVAGVLKSYKKDKISK